MGVFELAWRDNRRDGGREGGPDEHDHGQHGRLGGTGGQRRRRPEARAGRYPVADADCSKELHAGLGWRLDADFSYDNGFRLVQFTPPGSLCSIQFGTRITAASPGSAHGLYLVVSDIDAGRAELIDREAKVSDVFHVDHQAQLQSDDGSGRVNGPDLDHKSYSSFATFEDPDGNGWLLQEVTGRLPGRVEPDVTSLPATWPAPCDVRRQLTASTRSVSVRPILTGPTGTPPSWWPNNRRTASLVSDDDVVCSAEACGVSTSPTVISSGSPGTGADRTPSE